MNEVLIKELIKCKLNGLEKIVDSLPPEASGEIRKLGRIILAGINESCRGMEQQAASEAKHSEQLNNVTIE